jgi:ribosomal protein S12 methylthiotransferase
MNRSTSKKDIAGLIERIRKIVPGAAIRTTLITGFPSETDKEFEEMLEFVKEMRFERLGVFMYSREEGTPAHGMPGQVPYKVKESRFNRLMSAQQEISARINESLQGSTIDVLIDGQHSEGQLSAGAGRLYIGRSRHDAPDVDGSVFVRSKRKLSAGEFVRVRICDTMEYDLVGETIK